MTVLDRQSGRSFNLTGSGPVIWDALTEGATLEQITDRVVAAYAVGADIAAEDTQNLLRELLSLGLVNCER